MGAIAKVSVGQILGLVEAVDEVGGVADAATISQEVDMDLDRLGPIVDAAEFLGLLAIEDGDLRLTDLSQKLLAAGVRQRKAILRGVLQDVPAFRQIALKARDAARPLTRTEVVEALAAKLGSRRADDVFQALVYWGRYIELVRYDSRSEELTLRTPSK